MQVELVDSKNSKVFNGVVDIEITDRGLSFYHVEHEMKKFYRTRPSQIKFFRVIPGDEVRELAILSNRYEKLINKFLKFSDEVLNI